MLFRSRLTRAAGETKEYQDNFWKVFIFGKHITCATAGNAKLSAFVLRKMLDAKLPEENIHRFRESLKVQLPVIIDEYLKDGGEYKSSCFIFGGYNPSSKKLVNSSTFGNIQSKSLIGHKGVARQAVNPKMIEGIMKALLAGGQVQKDQMIEIDAPDSTVFTIDVTLPNPPIFRDTPCYNLALFGQGKLNETHVPIDVIQELEVKVDTSINGEEALYKNAVQMAALIDSMIKKYNLDTVGGNIVTVLISEHGAIIPTAKINKLDQSTGTITTVSEIIVHDEQFCTRGANGDIVPFEQIIGFSKDGSSKI